MALLFLLIAFILFVIGDYLIRMIVKNRREKKLKEEREEILKVSLNLDFSSEAKTLKRAEVENPKAKILCVDDEAVILDSFRKILVLDGYSIDTVENGQEALGLIQSHHYDFVFTDLKMPEMSGEDVCKSVKHLRPDIDVIIITGYASVESAVETMKYGAMDYIQKPFTEDELLDLVKKFLIRRQDKIRKQLKPKVHIKHLSESMKAQKEEFAIPGGVFIAEGHSWAALEEKGTVKVGLDDFAKKCIGKIDGIELPNLGMNIQKGQALFSIKQGRRSISVKSPVSGQVAKLNNLLAENPEPLDFNVYDKNWICIIDAENIDSEIRGLKIGSSAVDFYQSEIEEYQKEINKALSDSRKEGEYEEDTLLLGQFENLDDLNWDRLASKFFTRED